MSRRQRQRQEAGSDLERDGALMDEDLAGEALNGDLQPRDELAAEDGELAAEDRQRQNSNLELGASYDSLRVEAIRLGGRHERALSLEDVPDLDYSLLPQSSQITPEEADQVLRALNFPSTERDLIIAMYMGIPRNKLPAYLNHSKAWVDATYQSAYRRRLRLKSKGLIHSFETVLKLDATRTMKLVRSHAGAQSWSFINGAFEEWEGRRAAKETGQRHTMKCRQECSFET